MKLFTKILIPMLILGLVSVADAGGGKKKDKGGLKGKIVSVAADSITISTGSKKKGDGANVTIKIDGSTKVTIDGVAGKKTTDLVAGAKVSINPSSGTATDITATSKGKGKGKKAKA